LSILSALVIPPCATLDPAWQPELSFASPPVQVAQACWPLLPMPLALAVHAVDVGHRRLLSAVQHAHPRRAWLLLPPINRTVVSLGRALELESSTHVPS
jgi:hypothetical protein